MMSFLISINAWSSVMYSLNSLAQISMNSAISVDVNP